MGICLAAALLAALATRSDPARAQAVYNDGIAPECDVYKFELLPDFLDPFGLLDFDIAEEGWSWVDPTPSERFQQVSGTATRAKVSAIDNAANHYSHDFNVDVLVDEGQEHLVSVVNGDDAEDPRSPDKIEVEWEIGTRPNEHHGDGAVPFFPMWAWPSAGDRVWAEGNWVHDCGHPTARDGGYVYRSEIHSGRALAAMRDQSRTMPGSGTTPVPVTATDLYITGRGGFMVEQLYCGSEIILTGEVCATATNPIADNFEFDVCIPPKPFGTALLGTLIRDGPGNTIQTPEPQLDVVAASEDCKKAREPGALGLPKFDQDSMVHARVDLSGSGQPDTAVYARQMYTGWVFPASPPLRHFRLTLNRMDLHDDHDVDPGDCECTFFWLNVSTAEAERNPVENEWIRLQDYTEENMNDFDGDDGPGGGEEAEFADAVFEFYVRNRLLPPFETRFLQDTRVFANGYDQDCVDMNLMSGGRDNRVISPAGYVDCYAGSGLFELEPGRADEFGQMLVILQSSDFHGVDYPGFYDEGPEYELEFTVDEIAPALEDQSDVGVEKSCAPVGEVALVGEPFTCTITVRNSGTGLPRALMLTDTLETDLSPDAYSIDSASFTIAGNPTTFPCEIASSEFTCALGTVPVDGTATATVTITPLRPGTITNFAGATTHSTDDDLANNSAEATIEVFLPVEIDIKPGGTPNGINPGAGGSVPVAILTTPDFVATTVVAASVCFGDAEAPAQRDCSESHGTGHPQDVDKDRDVDLLLHYETQQTGIDVGDKRACLMGLTAAGIHVFGCDTVKTS
jgi:Domain of unknown function DUF11